MNAFRLTVGGRKITSLVMDEAEFFSLCDGLTVLAGLEGSSA